MIPLLLRAAFRQRFITITLTVVLIGTRHLLLPSTEDRSIPGHLRYTGCGRHAVPRARGRRDGNPGHRPDRARTQ